MAFRYLTLSPNSNIIFGNKQFFKWQREEGGREKEFPFPGSLPKTSAKPGLDGFQSQEAGSRSMVSRMGVRTPGTQAITAASWVCIGRKLDRRLELGHGSRHASVGTGALTDISGSAE